MEKSFGLFFFLKKARHGSDIIYYVYLRITVNGSSCEVSTKHKWDPATWNTIAGRTESKTEQAKLLNAYLDVL